MFRIIKAWYCLLGGGICGLCLAIPVSAQSTSYLQSARKAPSISNSQLPAFQSNASLNAQTLGILRSMYGNTGGAMPSSRPAAGIGGPTGSRSKPFSSYSPQPTVSPYLNLFRVDLNGNNDFNYSTLVQPQLQQQRLNQQLQQENLQNSRRVQAIAAQADYNPQGSRDQYPTGHQTVFNYWGHYYPQPQTNGKRSR